MPATAAIPIEPSWILDRIRREVSGAHALLAGGSLDDAEVVHEVRRSVTRARGALRLLAPRLAGVREDVDRVLRRFLHGVSARRDRVVVLEALADLRERALCDAERLSLDRCACLVDREGSALGGDDRPESEGQACGHLDAVEEALVLLEAPICADGCPCDGFAATYRRARRRFKAARRGCSGAAMHAWRRQVRHLRTQANLIGAEAPIDAGRLDRLAKTLGAHHDLWLVLAAADAMPSRRDRKRVRRVARRRANELGDRAFRIGRALFGEPSRELRARLHAL